MKQYLLKPLFLITIGLCVGFTLFAMPSLGGTAHAASAPQPRMTSVKADDCLYGLTNNYWVSSVSWILYPNEYFYGWTCSGNLLTLKYQSDGNFALYVSNRIDALWSSRTDGTCAGHTSFQSDGNLVVYDCHNHWVWQSQTYNKGAAYLSIQSDGNVVIYGRDGSVLWATYTFTP